MLEVLNSILVKTMKATMMRASCTTERTAPMAKSGWKRRSSR